MCEFTLQNRTAQSIFVAQGLTKRCGRLGAVYQAGNFRMSTWLPMVWGGVNVMVLVVTSFPMQGGL